MHQQPHDGSHLHGLGQHHHWQPLQLPAVAFGLQAAVAGFVEGTSPSDSKGIATISSIFALVVVLSYLAWIAGRNVTDTGLLIALAATLPRQIDLSYNVHGLASGWNDLLAVWTRMAGACAAIQPALDADFDQRIRFEGVSLSVSGSEGQEAVVCASVDNTLASIRAQSQGRFQVRGSNGSGKSTLLAALKARLGAQAFYWPTSDKLAFLFQGLPSANRRMKAMMSPLQAGFRPVSGS